MPVPSKFIDMNRGLILRPSQSPNRPLNHRVQFFLRLQQQPTPRPGDQNIITWTIHLQWTLALTFHFDISRVRWYEFRSNTAKPMVRETVVRIGREIYRHDSLATKIFFRYKKWFYFYDENFGPQIIRFPISSETVYHKWHAERKMFQADPVVAVAPPCRFPRNVTKTAQYLIMQFSTQTNSRATEVWANWI